MTHFGVVCVADGKSDFSFHYFFYLMCILCMGACVSMSLSAYSLCGIMIAGEDFYGLIFFFKNASILD